MWLVIIWHIFPQVIKEPPPPPPSEPVSYSFIWNITDGARWYIFMWWERLTELHLIQHSFFSSISYSIQDYLCSASHDTIIAKQLYGKFNRFIYCRNFRYLTYGKIWLILYIVWGVVLRCSVISDHPDWSWCNYGMLIQKQRSNRDIISVWHSLWDSNTNREAVLLSAEYHTPLSQSDLRTGKNCCVFISISIDKYINRYRCVWY